MICPKCQAPTEVEATRSTKRIRCCKECNYRFTTLEIFQSESPRGKHTRRMKTPIIRRSSIFAMAGGE